ncbi:hypothetical protein GQX59_08620 [Brachyspira hyodysenteriae]|uniref:hypothetical protein n=1 Tax=Brachyspira hyodysenteriae TaxID=159 RepID=UPI001ADDAA43|nr:hypothetical protein [Brachyspira hyodysenteriae]QTM11489.1 hypothetical protein GQX59_08620 [Brachyspira hyodysenteriae]
MDISNKALNIIREKIKELGNKELFDSTGVYESPIYDDTIEIQLMKDYVEYSEDDYFCTAYADIHYNTKNNKITIGKNGDYDVYDDDKLNSIPLLNFCYENKDKIKAIIKEALECGNEKK